MSYELKCRLNGLSQQHTDASSSCHSPVYKWIVSISEMFRQTARDT
jgi:hypothetical protein